MILSLCSCDFINGIVVYKKCDTHLKKHLEEMGNDTTLPVVMATVYQLDNVYGCSITYDRGLFRHDEQFIVDEEGIVFCGYCQNYEGNVLGEFYEIRNEGKQIYRYANENYASNHFTVGW